MEAQHNLSRVLKQVEEGHGVYITRRKRVVARILPIDAAESVDFPDFANRARKTWGGTWSGTDSSKLLDESRGER